MGDLYDDLQQNLNRLIAQSQNHSGQFFSEWYAPLCQAHYEPAILFFVGLLDDPREALRESALKALFELKCLNQMGLKKVRRLLLNDASEYVRLQAVRVIVRHGFWVESVLVRALKVEPVNFVRAKVFQAILELQGLPEREIRALHDCVLARSIDGTFEQAQGFVAEWKAEQAASEAAEVRRKEALFKYRNTLYERAALKAKPKVVYPRFQAFHTDLVKGKPLSARGVELLKANMNDEQGLNQYLEFVEQVGLCQVGNGFLWLVDPAEYAADLEDCAGLKPDEAVVFARTSFGHLLFVTREAILYWVSSGGYSIHVNDQQDFEFLLDWLLVDKDYLELFEFVAHQEAVEALGAPEKFEVFGFEAHAGNNGDDDTLERLGVHSHLKYLSHVHALRGWKQKLN